MRRVIIDASVSLKWIFEEEDSGQARKLLDLSEKRELLILAPSIWGYEIVNGFASAVLRKKLSYPKAKNLLKMILKSKPDIISTSDLYLKSLENCYEYKISAYDSAYVTLALENRVVFISSDKKLINKVGKPEIIMTVKDYVSANGFRSDI